MTGEESTQTNINSTIIIYKLITIFSFNIEYNVEITTVTNQVKTNTLRDCGNEYTCSFFFSLAIIITMAHRNANNYSSMYEILYTISFYYTC